MAATDGVSLNPKNRRFEYQIETFPNYFRYLTIGKILSLFGGPKHPQHLGALLTSFLEA